MPAGRGEGGEQATEGMRGSEAEDHVERLCGYEVFGLLVVKDKALLDAEVDRGGGRLGQGVLGRVHALGVQVQEPTSEVSGGAPCRAVDLRTSCEEDELSVWPVRCVADVLHHIALCGQVGLDVLPLAETQR